MYPLPILQMSYNQISLYMIYLIIIAFIILAYALINNDKSKQQPIDNTNIQARTSYYTKHRNHLDSRGERLERHKKVWAVLRFLKTVEALEESVSFYDFEKSITNFDDAKIRLREKEYSPSIEHINIAIRYIQHRNYTEDCERKLSGEEIKKLYDLEAIGYCKSTIFKQVANTFQLYWDDVITNYKQQTAKTKRKQYLINHINERKKMPVYQDIPEAPLVFDKFIQHYS